MVCLEHIEEVSLVSRLDSPSIIGEYISLTYKCKIFGYSRVIDQSGMGARSESAKGRRNPFIMQHR